MRAVKGDKDPLSLRWERVGVRVQISYIFSINLPLPLAPYPSHVGEGKRF